MNIIKDVGDLPSQLHGELKRYFGKYGGFFVPDPFTPALEAFAEDFSNVISREDFSDFYQKAMHALGNEPVKLSKSEKVGEAQLFEVVSTARQSMVAGYTALGKALDRSLVGGVHTKQQANDLLAASQALETRLSLVFGKELGSDTAFVAELGGKDVPVDIEKTSQLFDDPEMYAFQRYISNPNANLFVPLGTNIGPYPFPSISGNFCGISGQALYAAIADQLDGKKVSVLTSAFPGTAMIALLRGFQDKDVRLISLESSMENEREDCYCGAYTKVVIVDSQEFVMSPELLSAWEANLVERFQAENANAAITALGLSGDVIFVEEV